MIDDEILNTIESCTLHQVDDATLTLRNHTGCPITTPCMRKTQEEIEQTKNVSMNPNQQSNGDGINN